MASEQGSIKDATLPGSSLPRRIPRHQPVKIHTINTSSYTPATSSSHFSISSPLPFLNSPPPPMSASVFSTSANSYTASSRRNRSNSNVSITARKFDTNTITTGRSRSGSSSSGGVVFTTRPRAASAAARSTMEAMIQTRLDEITKRLDKFNAQAQGVHLQTEQLGQAFHEKARRLYKVEDHLLRLQGKPGLSEEYLEGEPQPRSLTDDLEELRLGVKTLRRKFQAAGTVATTVGWWKKLRDTDGGDGALRVAADDHDDNDFTQGVVHKKDNVPLHMLFAAPDTPLNSTDELSDQPNDPSPPLKQRFLELGTPPLTPDGSLSGSSLLQPRMPENHRHFFAPNLTSRPLSPIQDLEEPISLSSSVAPIAATAMAPSPHPLNNNTDNDASSSELKTHGSPSEHQRQQRPQNDIGSEPRPSFAFHAVTRSSPTSSFPNPTPITTPTSGVTEGLLLHEKRGKDIETASKNAHASREPIQHLKAHIHQQGRHQGSEQDISNVHEEDIDISSNNAGGAEVKQEYSDSGTHLNSPMDAHSSVEKIHLVNQKANDSTNTDGLQDGWIQVLWRVLVKAEYFFLGSAVLGAMMPDNVIALCAGFFSAIIYGTLLLHHRLTATPGKAAPNPPSERDITEADRRKQHTAHTTSPLATGFSPASGSTSTTMNRSNATATN
ncbi:hypothetical protein BGZ99_004082 [Dissophora globulifera]|uniref:Uncharacterized protein n=1 Tax=Dissophora globulifera TaxID=979702 RepID=A0A9P6UVA5_9FUNG|nr:hypothetical protein BGZ99_004082 [Dissophora globulifera]